MFKLYLAGAALAAVLALGLYARHEHNRADRAQAAAENSARQAKLNNASTEAVDQFHTQTIVIREKSDAGIAKVQASPGAETPVPPAVLDSWRSALLSLRNNPPTPTDQPPAKPES